MAFGVDYSFARPNLDALAAAGVKFVCRYLWPNTNGSKGISRAEYDAIRARGMDVVYIYEEDGTELTGGASAGVRVAQRAKQIMAQQGLPVQPVYFTIDHDYSGAQLAACVDAIKGASSVLGKGSTGIYGGYSHIAAMQAAGACGLFWQTYAWSGGRVAPGIHLYQYRNGQTLGGGSVDFCESKAANFGQSGAAVAGDGSSPLEDEDMGLPISFNKDAKSATVWVAGPIGYVGIQSPYHLTLLDRARKGDMNGILQAEMDIVYAYLRQIGAFPPDTIRSAVWNQPITGEGHAYALQELANIRTFQLENGATAVQLTPEQLEKLAAELATAVPHEFTVTGKATA